MELVPADACCDMLNGHACFFQCTVSASSGLWNSPRRDQHLPLLGRMGYICPAKPAAGLLKTTGICSILQKQQNFQITSQTSKKTTMIFFFSIAVENAATGTPCWKCAVTLMWHAENYATNLFEIETKMTVCYESTLRGAIRDSVHPPR